MFCVWAGLERFVLAAFSESLVLFQNSSSQFDKFVSDFPSSNKQKCVCGGGGGGGGRQTKWRLYSQSPNSLLCQKQSCSPTPSSVPNKTTFAPFKQAKMQPPPHPPPPPSCQTVAHCPFRHPRQSHTSFYPQGKQPRSQQMRSIVSNPSIGGTLSYQLPAPHPYRTHKTCHYTPTA